MKQDPLAKAQKDFHWKNAFEFEDGLVELALINENARPLRANWWKGKEVYIIAVDLDGNFLLRHCDGTVRYWIHERKEAVTVAPSVALFFQSLKEAPRYA